MKENIILATSDVVGERFQWVERDGQTGIYRPQKDSFEPISRGDMVHSLINEDLRVTKQGEEWLAK